jgi:Fibronectin type III domain
MENLMTSALTTFRAHFSLAFCRAFLLPLYFVQEVPLKLSHTLSRGRNATEICYSASFVNFPFTHRFRYTRTAKAAKCFWGGAYGKVVDLGLITERNGGNFPVRFEGQTTVSAKHAATFELKQAAAVQIDTAFGKGIADGSVTLSISDGTRNVFSQSLKRQRLINRAISSPTLPAGRYTLTLSNRQSVNSNLVSRVTLSSLKAPSRVEGVAWGGKTIRVNWLDNSDRETGFVVDRLEDGKWVRSATADANATAAVVEGLDVNTRYTFRVTAVTTNQQSGALNMARLGTESQDTSGWYKVLSLSGVTKAYAGWSINSGKLAFKTDPDGSFKDRWVFASSWQSAVSGAIEGSIEIKREDGSLLAPHPFPAAGSFKIATRQQLIDEGGTDASTKFKLTSGNPEDKLIVLEDSYGEVDRNYDDFWWGLQMKFAKINIKKTFSDQFPGAANNFLDDQPRPAGQHGPAGIVSDFILMGTDATDVARARLQLELHGDISQFKQDLSFGFEWLEESRGFYDQQVIQSQTTRVKILSHQWISANEVAIQSPPLGAAGALGVAPFRVVIGVDRNNDGFINNGYFYDVDEVVLDDRNIFQLVSAQAAQSAYPKLVRLVFAWQELGFPISANWLYSFLNGLGFGGATNSPSTILSSNNRLDHNVGADFSAINNVVKATYGPTSALNVAHVIANSTEISARLEEVLDDPDVISDMVLRASVINGYTASSVGPYMAIQLASGFRFTGDTNDLTWSLGGCELTNVRMFVDLKSQANALGETEVFITAVYVTGKVTDVYDFRFNPSDEGGYASLAAIIQAKYPTNAGPLGRGRIFLVEVNLNNLSTIVGPRYIGKK